MLIKQAWLAPLTGLLAKGVTKLAPTLGKGAVKGIATHAAKGMIGGAVAGAVTGGVTAQEGQGMQGAIKGGLLGGALGGLGGGALGATRIAGTLATRANTARTALAEGGKKITNLTSALGTEHGKVSKLTAEAANLNKQLTNYSTKGNLASATATVGGKNLNPSTMRTVEAPVKMLAPISSTKAALAAPGPVAKNLSNTNVTLQGSGLNTGLHANAPVGVGASNPKPYSSSLNETKTIIANHAPTPAPTTPIQSSGSNIVPKQTQYIPHEQAPHLSAYERNAQHMPMVESFPQRKIGPGTELRPSLMREKPVQKSGLLSRVFAGV